MKQSKDSLYYETQIKQRDDVTFVRWEETYKTSKSKAVVSCKEGHVWSASANNLVHGSGCPRCSGCYCRTKEEQELRFKSEFGFSFVSWVNGYKNNKSNAVVSCHQLHKFECNLVQLKKGKKCPTCQGSYKLSEKEAVNKINNSGLFNFVKWENKYSGVMSNVIVRCKKNHELSVRLTNILLGHGCNRCNSNWVSKEDREFQLNNLNGRRFVRWEDKYKNCFSKAVMACELNHQWSSPVMQLIKNTGFCPVCSPRGFNQNVDGTLYILRSSDGEMMKIGISNSPKNRFLQLRRSTPFKFRCIEKWTSDGVSVLKMENNLLSKFEKVDFNKKFDGYTEWRKWDPKVIDEIKLLNKETK